MIEDRPTHVVIPDTQVKPGVPTAHLTWIGRYIVDHFAGKPNVKLIHLGDHFDMPSLSSYDKGKKAMEGRRVLADIEAGNEAFRILNAPLIEHNEQRAAAHRAQWWPERHFLMGNHEDRITRAVESDAQLDGLLGLEQLETPGWERHGFLVPVAIDGVIYSHYFANPMSGRPYGGAALTRLKNIGHSFSMGHQQTLDIAIRFVRNGDGEIMSQHGLIAGACYLHAENYRGPQSDPTHWRGIVVCHDVRAGAYNVMTVDLDYLCRRYEGMELPEYLRSIGYRPDWER